MYNENEIKENKFVNLTVYGSHVREFDLHEDEKGYSITVDYKKDGTHVPDDGEYTFLLSEKRYSKRQPKNQNWISFWLFKDEKVKIQRSFKNPETNRWEREFVDTVLGEDLLKMCKNPEK